MALQMRGRNQAQGQNKADGAAQQATSPQVKQLVEKCDTIYDLFVHSISFFLTQTEQGQQAVKSAIEQAI